MLVRLANRLGVSTDELSMRLSSDVVRRTKYPVVEKREKDGKIAYIQPIQFHEGPASR